MLLGASFEQLLIDLIASAVQVHCKTEERYVYRKQNDEAGRVRDRRQPKHWLLPITLGANANQERGRKVDKVKDGEYCEHNSVRKQDPRLNKCLAAFDEQVLLVHLRGARKHKDYVDKWNVLRD